MKKILLTNLLVFVSWLALSQSQPIDPVYINTDSMASNTNNADLKLVGRGTGLVNIEGAYTLPGVDGTSGYLISTNGAGVWGYTDPSSLQVTFGTDNQVPFVNAGGTDFDYSGNLTFDGTTGTINNIQIAGSIITNNNAGSSTILSGGGANDGASVVLYDDTHATLANDITFRNNTSASAQYDHSASLWDFQNKAITTTGVGTFGSITLTTDLTVANGGTGASTLTGLLLGNGTSAITGVTTSSGISGAISDETGSGALMFGTSPTASTLSVTGGNAYTITAGSDATGTTITDATNKAARIASPHYTIAEEPVGLIFSQNISGTNSISIGGGSSIVNAATQIDFYAGATTTTTTGTLMGRITTSGWTTNGSSLSAGATTTTTMRNSSNAGTGDDLSYYDSDGDLNRSTIEITSLSNIVASVYTPAQQAATNVASSTFFEINYMRVNNMVTVFFEINITPTASATTTDISINLPVSSNLVDTGDLAGSGAGAFSGGVVPVHVTVDFANDWAVIRFTSNGTSIGAVRGSFGYKVN